MWTETPFARLLGLRYPIVQAPMAGGVATPELAAAVAEAGGLGSLAAGLECAADVRRAVRATRAKTSRPFQVNLFVPEPVRPPLRSQLRKTHALLRPLRDELGLPPLPTHDGAPRLPESEFDGQVEAVLEERVPAVSFTFGLPSKLLVERFHETGARVLATVTCVEEAREAVRRGVDVVVAQGREAGGERGGWVDPMAPPMCGTFVLVPQVVDAVGPDVPVVAAGGVMDGRGLAAALALGAAGVQMGTAFVTSHESGAPPTHKQEVVRSTPGGTVVTRAFTGKPTRAIATRVTRRLAGHEYELPPYPVQQAFMRDILEEAARQERRELLPLLAGEGAPMARELPARELVEMLVKEADAVLERVAH